VMHDVPNTMHYYCTSHAAMKGEIKIVDASGGSSATNLSPVANGTSLTVESSTGNNASLPAATTSAWGVMTDEDKTKLDGIDSNATANALISSLTDVDAFAGSGADQGKFVKVKTGSDAIEFVAVSVPANISDLGDVDAIGSNTNRGRFLKVKTGSDAIEFVSAEISPGLMFATQAIGGVANADISGALNGGDGGTLVVTPQAGQNAAGTATGYGVMVDTDDLTKESKKSRYEILSATSGKGFRFKAKDTVIDAFGGGQAQIATGIGDSDGVSVSDAQKLVLLYTGSAWKYMIQSI
jgi:hypothetical protein